MAPGGTPMTRPVAIVTAAGSGIGAGVARTLAADHDLVLFARSEAVVEFADELGATAVRGSLTELADLERLVATTIGTFGRIDAVVSNSGHPPKSDLLALTQQDWSAGIDLLFTSVTELARLVTPHMVAGGGGAWVFITSYASLVPEPVMPVSSVVRAALQNWVKLYATAVAQDGIRANCLLPGFVATHPVDPDRLATIPQRRYADPEEIGRVARFLLSDEASFITGQNHVVDGGMIPVP